MQIIMKYEKYYLQKRNYNDYVNLILMKMTDSLLIFKMNLYGIVGEREKNKISV